MVRGLGARNRGVEGDEVAIEPLPLGDWFVVHREAERVSCWFGWCVVCVVCVRG